MKGIKKFFSGLLVLILILIILGGVGFIGYSILKSGGMKMSSMSSTSTDTTKNTTDTSSMSGMSNSTTSTDTTKNTTDTGSMSGMTNNTTTSNTNTQNQQSSTSLNQINAIMQNKDLLDKTALLLDDSLKLMTLDPFAVDPKTQNNNVVTKGQDNTVTTPTDSNTNKTTQGNTTININPPTSTTSTNSTVESVMPNMGAAYDQGKMEQVHAGLYKLSIGMQLLDQLKDNLSNQIEKAGVNVNDVPQYYINQYYITMDNKNKLNSILTYLNDSANLININPYIAISGAVYDKDRMSQIHQSIIKRAEGIVGLNKLGDNFSNQLITLTNLAQNSSSNNQMNMNSTSMFSGLLANLNLSTIASGVLVIFVLIFIIGLLGFVKSLFKPANVSNNK